MGHRRRRRGRRRSWRRTDRHPRRRSKRRGRGGSGAPNGFGLPGNCRRCRRALIPPEPLETLRVLLPRLLRLLLLHLVKAVLRQSADFSERIEPRNHRLYPTGERRRRSSCSAPNEFEVSRPGPITALGQRRRPRYPRIAREVGEKVLEDAVVRHIKHPSSLEARHDFYRVLLR